MDTSENTASPAQANNENSEHGFFSFFSTRTSKTSSNTFTNWIPLFHFIKLPIRNFFCLRNYNLQSKDDNNGKLCLCIRLCRGVFYLFGGLWKGYILSLLKESFSLLNTPPRLYNLSETNPDFSITCFQPKSRTSKLPEQPPASPPKDDELPEFDPEKFTPGNFALTLYLSIYLSLSISINLSLPPAQGRWIGKVQSWKFYSM